MSENYKLTIMKELSIEEKAKAYDEALEKIHQFIDGYSSREISKEKLEDIFPELKESEDESIRKAIIQHFKTTTDAVIGHSICNIPIEKVLAWLEKQKTSDKALQYLKENHSPSEVSDFQAAMNIAVAKAYDKGYNDGLKNQGEQKSAWSEDDEKMFDAIMCSLDEDKLQRVWNLNEDDVENWLKSFKEIVPNLKWSEEDKIIIGVLNELVDATPYKDFHNATKYDCIKFLRTIEKRVFPQPQQELNEEDLHKIEHALIDTYAMDSASKILNKIKSIRPQTTWKPSDEQMVALDGICSYIRNKADWEISQDTVSDLYKLSEQLKKLKE